jgi:hypothetical protein
MIVMRPAAEFEHVAFTVRKRQLPFASCVTDDDGDEGDDDEVNDDDAVNDDDTEDDNYSTSIRLLKRRCRRGFRACRSVGILCGGRGASRPRNLERPRRFT